MENTNIIILAGEEEKMKSKTATVLQKVCFKPMIDYVVNASKKVSNLKPTVVCEKEEEIKEHLKDSVNYSSVKDAINNSKEKTTIILKGNLPEITGETLKNAVEYHNQNKLDATSIVFKVWSNELPIVIFNTEKLKEFTSKEDFCLNKAYKSVKYKGEYLVEDVNEISACDDKIKLAKANENMRIKTNNKLMENGVIIINPEDTYIEDTVKIGMDTVIYPDCFISGNTVIGENCEILTASHIENSEIADNVSVKTSTLLECKIGKNTTVGPYAYIRPASVVGENCRIGDFVELKKAKIGNGTKVSHLTYLGDAVVGERVNFGCGTVSVNYDGINKFQTTIGNDVFVGCNANLVAPVTIGDNSFIAAGSTITDEVPEDAFAIARARQTNKEGWVKPKDRK